MSSRGTLYVQSSQIQSAFVKHGSVVITTYRKNPVNGVPAPVLYCLVTRDRTGSYPEGKWNPNLILSQTNFTFIEGTTGADFKGVGPKSSSKDLKGKTTTPFSTCLYFHVHTCHNMNHFSASHVTIN